MTIIDTATVSVFLVVLAIAVVATAITAGLAVRSYYAGRPARAARVAGAPGFQYGRLAH